VIQGGRRYIVVLPRPAVPGVPGRSALAPVSQEVSATVVGIDVETDLAILKVDQKNLPFARLGNSDSLTPGQVVLAFGSPFGSRQQRHHGSCQRRWSPAPGRRPDDLSPD
jgi:trypsin-like peptidase